MTKVRVFADRKSTCTGMNVKGRKVRGEGFLVLPEFYG